MSTNKPIILVDGSSYLYRAFHAMPALTNSKGAPTGAVYGMVNMLKKLLTDYQPEYMAVIFDAKGKTFRDEMFEAYKATRQEMPNELVLQIEPIHQIIKALGLPIIMVEGVEADDVIGTLAAQAAKEQKDLLISTGDKDLAQLVNNHVTLVNTMTNSLLNPENVKKKFGVHPHQIVDYLTLIGDTSDNIPGVPQVGPKTAAKWLQEYSTLDSIITNADKITGKVGENLRSFLTQIPLSKALVTIKLDVELPLNLLDLKIQSADKKTLLDLYRAMEFKNWLSELLENNSAQPNPDHAVDTYANYAIIHSEALFKEWIGWLKQADIIAFDTETTSLDYMTAQLVGVSFAIKSGKAAYVPFGHDYLGAPAQLPKEYVLAELKPILGKSRHQKNWPEY